MKTLFPTQVMTGEATNPVYVSLKNQWWLWTFCLCSLRVRHFWLLFILLLQLLLCSNVFLAKVNLCLQKRRKPHCTSGSLDPLTFLRDFGDKHGHD